MENLSKITSDALGYAFPTDQDLVDISGMTYFDLLFFFWTCWIPDSQISTFLDFQISRFKAVS